MINLSFRRTLAVLYASLTLWSFLGQRAQSVGTPYPTCANVTEKCASGSGCKEIPISFTYTEDYSPNNVLCINQGNDDASPVANPLYRLQGCHTLFYNSYQNTSGVCSITNENNGTSNGTELLLTGNEMVPGLHSFDCLVEESPIGMVSSNAIVVTDKAVYRDFLMYVNGVLQYRYNSTNITLDVGNNLTVVVRAVGLNVSVITANDTRFTCKTGFACNQQYNLDNVPNRYLQCSLRTPAKKSDNDRTLLVSIDDVEMMSFAITVNESSPATKEEEEDPNIPIYAYVIAGVIIIIIVGLLVGGITFYRKHSQKQTDEEEGNLIEKEIFRSYYHKLVHILPVRNILYQLVPVGIISEDDVAEINSMPRPTDKASFILNKICRHLEAGYKDNFYKLLDIMEGCCNDDVRIDIRRALMTVLISNCSHCNQLDIGNKLHGYAMKKIPTGTDIDENVFKAYLDKGIPLITCSCSECEVVTYLLGSISIPESWKILQLHQTDSGNSLQSNGRVKVIHTDLDDGVPVSEVLNWLKANVPRRGSTASSVCSQQGALGQSGE